MKKTLSKIWTFILRVPLMLRSLREIFRRGGYATYRIATIQHGKRLDSKRILVTGGSSGIGFAIARKCIAEGGRVLITGRDIARLNKAAAEINSPQLVVMEWDVSNTDSMSAKIEEARRLMSGDIDILVNNAGLLSTVQFPEVTEEIWDQVYSTNSRGLFFLTQRLCKSWMQAAGEKKILNISSQGGFVGATYPYRMTKWDVSGLTQGLGIKLAPYGIIVNGIAPGIVATDMQPDILKDSGNIYSSLNPLGRHALPEEIAELAVFLMSDVSNFIVGQTIVCDGGFSIK